jgi:thiamine monophosphate synthase
MAIIGFFFLCRPGEHTKTKNNTPFQLQDVTLFRNGTAIDWHTMPVADIGDIDCATSAQLMFTTQKNGVKGETMQHGMTGDPHVCPVRALVRRIIYLRRLDCPLDTPLCHYLDDDNSTQRFVSSAALTKLLRLGIAIVKFRNPSLAIEQHEVDARSLRAGGATALLCARAHPVDTQLFGRWKSDTMIRYLHITYNPVVKDFARKMFAEGDFLNPPPNSPFDGTTPVHWP